jgi:macrolide transport system ATP-binding/permease protein
MIRDLLYRLRALFRRNSLEAEMDAELRAHLEHQTEKHLRAGLPPEEAARRARLEFGGVEQVKEECRDRWGVRLINEVIQDVRYGLRQLHRNPGFTAVAVLTLALGIGANTAIFSIFNAVMLKTLPVQNPGQLVLFSTTTDEGLVNSTEGPHGRWNYFSTPVFEYIRDHNRVFQGIGAFQRLPDTLIVRAGDSTAGNPPERAKGRLVSGNYFSVLGVNAIEGRTLTPQDDQPSAHPTAVISYSYWKRKFNQRPSLVGQAVDVNGVPFIIVGVAPPEFYGSPAPTSKAIKRTG